MTISKHAKERYAERIMDRDNKTDIVVFIRDHEDKIQKDIEKMVEYGALLYEGPTSKDPRKDVAVTLNGQWVVIWDAKEMVVITLYCIDLGVGEEVNKAFIESAVNKINEARDEYEQTVERTNEQITLYKELIEDGQGKLDRYRKICRDLESNISGCKQMIATISADNEIAKERVRDQVEVLIGRQRF